MAALGLAAVIGTGCTSAAPSTTEPPDSCTRDVVDGCEVVGVVFADPVPLADTLETASAVGGITLAVFRTDYVCIADVAFSSPDEVDRHASRIAYVDPDELEHRRLAAQGDLAPMVTGHHIVAGFFVEMAEEWTKTQQPMVHFDGAVVYVPAGAPEVLADNEALGWIGDVAWGLTPSLDRTVYPGELTVDADALDAVAIYPTPEPPSCD